MAPKKDMKRKGATEEKLVQDEALRERQQNREHLEKLKASKHDSEVICLNLMTLLDRNMVLWPKYINPLPSPLLNPPGLRLMYCLKALIPFAWTAGTPTSKAYSQIASQ